MINQLTHRAALAHNEDLLRHATAARRAAALHPVPSLRDALKRLAPRHRASAPRFGSSYKLANGKWIHGAR